MPKPTDTWMPLYIGDYLADTQHLSFGEHGVYLLLIMAYWRNSGPLPDDDRTLRRIAKCDPRQWTKMRLSMSSFFDTSYEQQNGDKVWRHKRIDAELENAGKLANARQKGGRITAAKRWGPDSSATLELLAQPIASRAPVLPSQSQSQSEKVSKGEASRSNLDFQNLLPDPASPRARGAPAGDTEPEPQPEGEESGSVVFGEENPGAADAALALADRKRALLEMKLIQFAKDRLPDTELNAAMLGLMGQDPDRSDQWWFNKLDKLMRGEHHANSSLTEH